MATDIMHIATVTALNKETKELRALGHVVRVLGKDERGFVLEVRWHQGQKVKEASTERVQFFSDRLEAQTTAQAFRQQGRPVTLFKAKNGHWCLKLV